MIDLNTEEFNFEKKFLSRQNILEDINEYSIFRHYAGDFTPNAIMSSPFRTDRSPSFGIFFSKKFNCLLFKDLAKGITGDCFSLVNTFVHPTFTRVEAMAQVVTDFGLEHRYVMPRVGFKKGGKKANFYIPPKRMEKDIKPIGIRARRYTVRDYSFWARFGIPRDILKMYNVVPISHFTYGNAVYSADEIAYAYIENKDDHVTYKIYQPFSDKMKFFTDMDSSIHSGYTQLPEKGEVMLITKSLKDVMSIRAVTGVPSISVLSETVFIKEKVIKEYKNRFDFVFILFDNDEAGQNMSREYSKAYDLKALTIPKYFEKAKDFSDVVKVHGISAAENMLETNIWLAQHEELDDLPF